jgi:hypothetical protein
LIINQKIIKMNNKLSYPLEFEFKVMALAPQFYVRDAEGKEVAYVKQKLFKLKEDITVFQNESQTTPIYSIKANKWIDWSASYLLSNVEGIQLGRMGRKGARSIWKATYEIFDEKNAFEFKIEEANAFVKVLDGLFSEIPVLGLFTGYMFNPTYNVLNTAGVKVGEFKKEASLLGKKFKFHLHQDIDDVEEERILLSLMMMVLLERARG